MLFVVLPQLKNANKKQNNSDSKSLLVFMVLLCSFIK